MKRNAIATTIAAAALMLGQQAIADQVILDDLIVDGSTCVGQDCVNGESFGFDTIRLKENNLRIKFQDTSSSASFPTNDWQLTANDSSNGGANRFSIDDIDGGRTPFTVEAGAPSHSLYVDDGGRIGLGTSTPSVQVHTKDGNSPTLRLEQDGSSGFTSQTWDVAGNEANFFIRDVTHSSNLPFRIQPGAPSESLTIKSDGKIGLGTWSPSWALHLVNSGTIVSLAESSSDGAVQFRMKTSSNNRRLVAVDSGDNVMSQVILDNNKIKFSDETNLYATIDSTGLTVEGSITTTASGQVHPDYVFKSSYELMPLDALKAFVDENKHLPEIPSASDVAKNGLNITEMQIKLLKKVEELTLYTIRQQETIDALSSKLSKMDANL